MTLTLKRERIVSQKIDLQINVVAVGPQLVSQNTSLPLGLL